MARKNENTNLGLMMEIMEPSEDALRGLSFSITGHLGRPRGDVVKLIESAGGRFHRSPAPDTRYLITNNDWNTGSVKGGRSKKLMAAERSGVKIISESEFYEMLTKSDE